MPPKRQRAKKGKQFQDAARESTYQFVSDRAKARYEYAVQKQRGFIAERGICFDDTESIGITDRVNSLGWQQFVREPTPAVRALVMEFYANAAEAAEDVTIVRGKEVRFDPQTINAFYQLEDAPAIPDNFEADAQTIIGALAKSGAQWSITREGHIGVFKRAQLEVVESFWFYFVCSRLVPSSHVSEVDLARSQYLYAIHRRLRYDVGTLLRDQIRFCASSTRLSYYFPHLVSALCIRAGVGYESTELVLRPGPKLNKSFLDSLCRERSARPQRDSALHEPQAAPDLCAEDEDHVCMPSDIPSSSAPPMPPGDTERLARIEAFLTQHADWSNRQARYNQASWETCQALFQHVCRVNGIDPDEIAIPPAYPGDFVFHPPPPAL